MSIQLLEAPIEMVGSGGDRTPHSAPAGWRYMDIPHQLCGSMLLKLTVYTSYVIM
jgi:hypothetical protein